MDRRTFLSTSAIVPAACALPRWAFAQSFGPQPGRWRTFEIVTRVEILKPAGGNRAWVPLPVVESGWQKPLANQWTGNGRAMERITEKKYGASLLYAEWADGEKAPWVEVVSRFQTQDRLLDWSQKGAAPPESAATLALWTQPTDLMPTDGIVRKTAEGIVQGKATDVDKVRALYDWVVTNSYREPKVRGCGVGDISVMLETGNLGGKCADLNALFVGMARAVGVPARDVYGLRLSPSKWDYRSMSASGNVTRAQHCRAEFYSASHGWVPVDPADVRKVVLEEPPGNLRVTDAKVKLAREKLFGAWEMNWLAYNYSHDIKLPNSKGAALGFLMYPQVETATARKDPYDPDNVKYTITSKLA
jgi:transglutaminase-like putative cysteine protease